MNRRSQRSREIIFIVFALTACSLRVIAQQPVQLHNADSLVGKTLPNGQEVRELSGSVHFSQGNVRVWCDRAVQYLVKNEYELIGRVRVIRDTVTLTSQYGRYYGATKQAYAERDVRLKTPHVTLLADRGTYYTVERRAWFTQNVHMIDSATTIDCDDMTYDENERKTVANFNVRIVNAQNNVTMYGGHLDHFDEKHYSKLNVEPIMLQIDTSARGEIDTLTIRSMVMESYDDSTKFVVATDSVTIVRAALAARAGVVRFHSKDERIDMLNKPIVWYDRHQVTGDTISIYMEKKQLEHAVVRGHAFALSESDSAYPRRFNQLTGRRMTLRFANRKLTNTVVERNAISLYFLYEGTEPNGVNKTSGDYISMSFTGGKPDIIRVLKGIEGMYYPEPIIARNDQACNLDGFILRSDRPTKRNGVR